MNIPSAAGEGVFAGVFPLVSSPLRNVQLIIGLYYKRIITQFEEELTVNFNAVGLVERN